MEQQQRAEDERRGQVVGAAAAGEEEQIPPPPRRARTFRVKKREGAEGRESHGQPGERAERHGHGEEEEPGEFVPLDHALSLLQHTVSNSFFCTDLQSRGKSAGKSRLAPGRPSIRHGGRGHAQSDSRLVTRRLSSKSPAPHARRSSVGVTGPNGPPDRTSRRAIPEDRSVQESSLHSREKEQDNAAAHAPRFPRIKSDNSFANSAFGTVASSEATSQRPCMGMPPSRADGSIETSVSDSAVRSRDSSRSRDGSRQENKINESGGDVNADPPSGARDGPSISTSGDPTVFAGSIGEDDLATAESSRRGRSSRGSSARHSSGASSLLGRSAPSLFGESCSNRGKPPQKGSSAQRFSHQRSTDTTLPLDRSNSTQQSSQQRRSSGASSPYNGSSCATRGPVISPVDTPPQSEDDDDDTAGPSFAGYDEDDGSAVCIEKVENVLAQLTLLRRSSDGTPVDQDEEVEEIFSNDESSLGIATSRSLVETGTDNELASGDDDESRRTPQSCAPSFGDSHSLRCSTTPYSARRTESPSAPRAPRKFPPPRKQSLTAVAANNKFSPAGSSATDGAGSGGSGGSPSTIAGSGPVCHFTAVPAADVSGSDTDGDGTAPPARSPCPKTPRPRPNVPPMTSATARMMNVPSVENLIVSTRLAGPGLYSGSIDEFGTPNGLGFAHFDSGRYFDGEWINGLPNAVEFLAQNPPLGRFPSPPSSGSSPPSGPPAPVQAAPDAAQAALAFAHRATPVYATPVYSSNPRADPTGGFQIQMFPPPFCPGGGSDRQQQFLQQ